MEKEFKMKNNEIKISSPDDAASFLFSKLDIALEPEEVFGVIFCDTKNNIIGSTEVSRGSLNSSIVHPREVFKRAMIANCSRIILYHNHPSGEPEPSPEDITITNRLCECGKILGIQILDHVITGHGRYFSFLEESLI